MLLSKLLEDVKTQSEYSDVSVSDVTDSSSRIIADCVFVAIKGTNFDGHDFVHEALAKGAAIAVVSHDMGVDRQIIVENTREAYALMCRTYFGKPDTELAVIGITGTNGKSSTAALLCDAFSELNIPSGSIGTLGNRVGNKMFPTAYTTPAPYELYRLLRLMVNDGIKHAVIETTSQAFDQNRLSGITFEVGVFTNLTQDHLDYHGSIENYKACKKQLFLNSKNCIINSDDEAAGYMADGVPGKVITYSVDGESDYKAADLSFDEDGVAYKLNGTAIVSHPPAKFSVYNSAAAVAALECVGIPFADACDAVNDTASLKGRLEIIKTDTDYKVVIDYAHTPDGFEKVLEAVRGYTAGRVIVVFGCGGDRDKTKRPKMGRVAADLSDIAIITTDNPRTEDPVVIIKEILMGMVGSRAKTMTFLDRTEAIENALSLAKSGDTVLLAGKGHETYQIIGTERVHYDEREIVRGILERSSNGEA